MRCGGLVWARVMPSVRPRLRGSGRGLSPGKVKAEEEPGSLSVEDQPFGLRVAG